MQTIVVLLIVAIAAAFLIRNFLKKFKQKDQGSCGCSSCPTDSASCEENPDKFVNVTKGTQNGPH